MLIAKNDNRVYGFSVCNTLTLKMAEFNTRGFIFSIVLSSSKFKGLIVFTLFCLLLDC